MSTPIFAYENGVYTFMLFRAEGAIGLKKETYVFDKHYVSICGCAEYELNERGEREKVKGPAASDGILYYIWAKPHALMSDDEEVFVWLETKGHALILRHKMDIAHDAEEEAYRAELIKEGDTVCTYCWQRPSEGCSEDHGDEMREAQREALRRD